MEFLFLFLSILATVGLGYFSYKNKKIRKTFFYLYHLVTFYIFLFLNQHVLLPIFGCGCVPSVQENILHIPINTNQITSFYYFSTFFLLLFFAYRFSKSMSKKERELFLISLILWNALISFYFLQILMWQ